MSTAAVQKAVYAALDAALSVSVYDDPPQDTDPPFVVVGADTGSPSDTKEKTGIEHRVQVDIFSAYRGYKEVKTLLDQIYAALHRTLLTVEGCSATQLQFVYSDYFDDPGIGKHGVISFSLQTTPE